jgi:hypothetical protein
VLATHVGSLIRPPALIDHLREMEAGRPVDQGAYERPKAKRKPVRARRRA